MLYIATGHKVTRRAWDEDDRHVWTADVYPGDESVAEHLSLPHFACVGSDLKCGCGFRHLSFQGGAWENLMPDDEMGGTVRNHEELRSVLADALGQSPLVELYGCWSGDEGAKTEDTALLELDDILSPDFFLRERVLYRVKGGGGSG